MKLSAQTLDFKLTKASCGEFKNHIVVYGLTTHPLNTEIKFYKISKALSIVDSAVLNISGSNPENYLSLSHDTLHGYFNVYVQEVGKKTTDIYRINKQFKVVAIIKQVEIARLNNLDVFEQTPYYNNQFVYSVKRVNDTSGKQFFLNKFSLKDTLTNFEYKQVWQFPFDKKDIRHAEVIFANSDFVFIHASLFKGNKQGEWLLKLNATNGKLIKGTKLNKNNEIYTYMPGYLSYNGKKKSLFILGEKLSDNEINFLNQKFKPSNLCNFYSLEIDSLGEILNRFDLKTSIILPTQGKHESEAYLTRIAKTITFAENAAEFELDIYKKKNPNCYVYAHSAQLKFELNTELPSALTQTISQNILIETNYISSDKFDLNGQVCMEQVENIEDLYRKAPLQEVKQGFVLQKDKNPKWLLKKTNPKSNLISYSTLKPGAKTYELNKVDEFNKYQNSGTIIFNAETFLIFSQTDNTTFSLKLVNW